MREQIEERLAALRQEFEAGRRMLGELDARQAELQQTLLRIGGAVQVLEELLGKQAVPAAPEPEAANGRAEMTGVSGT